MYAVIIAVYVCVSLSVQLRVVCWKSKDVPFDGGLMDLFSTFWMEGNTKKFSTDTHWRSKDGQGESPTHN
jgi:hypothetical protein